MWRVMFLYNLGASYIYYMLTYMLRFNLEYDPFTFSNKQKKMKRFKEIWWLLMCDD